MKCPAVRVLCVDGRWEVYACPTQWESYHLGSFKRSGVAVAEAFLWLARNGLTGWRVYKQGVVVGEVGYE